MVLEAKGYAVVNANEAADLVLMDLRIPTAQKGRAMIRQFHAENPRPKIVVLSGATEELKGTPEEAMTNAILEKPCLTGKLLHVIERLLLLLLISLPVLAQLPDIQRHAPILFARPDTVKNNSDIPLLMYCEYDKPENALTYTVIFSNEDGGTSTRALMATWGRTTDIEYIYKVWLNADGSAKRAQVQGRNHQDINYAGPKEGDRPLLIPVTKNNMVDGATPANGALNARRFDLKPTLVDLSNHSREYVMDLHPETWKLMRDELVRENKLRPYGSVRGEDISDPLNYLYIEMKTSLKDGASISAGVKRKASAKVQMGHLGSLNYAVPRSGWMRNAIELPPGTKISEVESIFFACYGKGTCTVNEVTFVELNGQRGKVGLKAPIELKPGEVDSATLQQ